MLAIGGAGPTVLFDAHQLGRRQTGNETYVRELLKCFRRRDDLRLIGAVEKEAGVAGDVLLPEQKRVVPRNGLGRLLELWRIARRDDVDILHAIYFLPPNVRRPTVVTIHDVSFESHPEFFARSALLRDRLLIRSSAQRARRVITISETSRRDLLERYELPDDHVVAIPLGVSDAFQPAEGSRWVPYSGDRALRVLAVGTLQPRKNLNRLIDALRLVGRRTPVELRVVGPDGHDAASIRGRLSQDIRAEAVGWITEPELVREYQSADVFVYPSIYEGFGLPVLEAMACGTPVVTSSGGALPEVAGDAAAVVDPLSVEEIAEAILRLAEDPERARSLRKLGLDRAAHHSWDRCAEAHIEVYRNLLTE